MGVAHRARASAGLDQHVMAASPRVVRPLWREGRPRSVGSKLAKKKNDEALWGDSAPVCGEAVWHYIAFLSVLVMRAGGFLGRAQLCLFDDGGTVYGLQSDRRAKGL